jgi:dipeptidyl aminopeptidase/acylaminoacyl peptidase
MTLSRSVAAVAALITVAQPALAAVPAKPSYPHLDDLAAKFAAEPLAPAVSISPSGDAIAYVVRQGTSRAVAVYDVASQQTRLVQSDRDVALHFRECVFKTDTRLICSLSSGAFKFFDRTTQISRTVALDRDGRNPLVLGLTKTRNIFPLLTSGHIVDQLSDDPQHVLMRLPDAHLDVARVDIQTNKLESVETSRGYPVGYLTDSHGNVRLMERTEAGKPSRTRVFLFARSDARGRWIKFADGEYGAEEPYTLLGFDADNAHVLVLKPKDGRAALYRLATDGTGTEELVFAHDQVDVQGILRVGHERRPVAAFFNEDGPTYHFFDPAYEKLSASIRKALPDTPDVFVLGESWDGTRKVIFTASPTDPGMVSLFNSKTHELRRLIAAVPELEGMKLGQVTAVRYPASDGALVPGLLTLPPGRTNTKGLPALMLPHGGPFARDVRRFDFLAQFYASQGYAVLQPNYRGSAGYGKEWLGDNAIKGWRRSIGDINSGAHWLLAQGVDPKRLGIAGWSYGGYAALQCAIIEPGLYHAIVAIAPVTDFGDMRNELTPTTSRRELFGPGDNLAEGSPARHAAAIAAPVFLAQGNKDLNVPYAQSKKMDAALSKAGKPHVYLTYAGEDHQIADPDARADLLRRSAAFLQTSLGG